MSPKPGEPDQNNSRFRGYRQIALATSIPIIMVAAPAVGYLIGRYLDKIFGTERLMMAIFLLLGVAAGGLEAYRLIKQIVKEGGD